jgi:Ca2+-binding RTX toxin-like protein
VVVEPVVVEPVIDANTNSALTTGIDALTGGSGSDTVSGSQTTLNAGDSFSGGTGADLLAVFTSAQQQLVVLLRLAWKQFQHQQQAVLSQ